jgi:CRP-like cAMP-binding protein
MKIFDPAPIQPPPKKSALISLFDAVPFQKSYQPDSTVLLHGHPADAVYLIVSGTVRCCTISAHGCRQIFRFATKGQFLGISDIDRWHFTAEAVDHVILKSVPRRTVEQALAVNVALRQELRAHMACQLQCREQQLLSIVTSKAPERLLGFLRDFAASRRADGYVVLPMSRRDIADHLGMSVETVSRAFGTLKSKGLIDLQTSEKYCIIADTGRAQEPKLRAVPA